MKKIYDEVRELFKISDKAFEIYKQLKYTLLFSNANVIEDKNILIIYRDRQELRYGFEKMIKALELHPTNYDFEKFNIKMIDGTTYFFRTIEECNKRICGNKFNKIYFK